MKPYKQLFRHQPEQGIIGDCWRTAIGCLLNLPPDQVPHFGDGCFDDSVEFHKRTNTWLRSKGYSIVETAFDCPIEYVFAHLATNNPDRYCLLSGTSRSGFNHTVIACNDQIVWDPSLTDAGIVGPCSDGFYWVSWLIPSILCADEPNGKSFSNFDILAITTAYEQGFGHAFRDELSNPYKPGIPAHIAWDMGRTAGRKQKQGGAA